MSIFDDAYNVNSDYKPATRNPIRLTRISGRTQVYVAMDRLLLPGGDLGEYHAPDGGGREVSQGQSCREGT